MDAIEYITYLLSCPGGSSCRDASGLLEVSHDQVNRFLISGNLDARALFESAVQLTGLRSGVLSVDDTVLDKPYRDIEKTELVDFFWSGKHHRAVKGINLIVLIYTRWDGTSAPVNFRLYRHSDKKTKNDYFLEMMREVWAWGLRPSLISLDSWYSAVANLKFLRNLEVDLLVGLKANRQVSTQAHHYRPVAQEEIPEQGLWTHLRGFGRIKLFRTTDSEQLTRHYAYYTPEHEQLERIGKQDFERAKLAHWKVEQFFRCIKQACQAQNFFVRTTQAIQTHMFCVLRAAQLLQAMVRDKLIPSVYAFKKCLFMQAQKEFIRSFA